VYAQVISLEGGDQSCGEDVFAIIDALYLAGKDVRGQPYAQRYVKENKV
jgi:hypothetical protein